MKIKLPSGLRSLKIAALVGALALAVGSASFAIAATTMKKSDKAYKPGGYGEVKDAPMFICWREWDGEIRLGGVAKSLSKPFLGGHTKEAEDYFAGEIQGPSGSANHEQLMFSTGTTNIVIKDNYTGTVEIGGKRLTMAELRKL